MMIMMMVMVNLVFYKWGGEGDQVPHSLICIR